MKNTEDQSVKPQLDEIVTTPIVFFSGLDRTGKTTTRKQFAVQTNQKYITFDRSPIDNIVYDEAFRGKRVSEMGLETFIKKWKSLGEVYIVHMTLGFDEVNKRTKATEGSDYPMDELVLCSKLFEKYFKYAEHYGIKMVRVQCDEKSVDHIVNEIITKIGGTQNG